MKPQRTANLPMSQPADGPVFAVIDLLAVLMAIVAGCASKESVPESGRPGGGIAEYRQIATDAATAIQRALESLNTVAAQTNRCEPGVLAAFSDQVQRLQVESVQVRARSQAMQARGDAYFERWHENMAQVKDSQRRALAEQRRPLLHASFQKVKSMSQEGREAFQPFLSGLRKVRNTLEQDPASLSATTTQDSISTAREKGKQVQACLAGIQLELDSMTAMITPSETAAQH